MTAETGERDEPPRAGSGGLVLGGGLVDLGAGLVLAAAGAGLFVVARSFDEVDNTGVGPATFPKGIAVLVVMTALMLAGRGAVSLTSTSAAVPVHIGRPLSVVVAMALVAAFPLMMTSLGYYLAMALWMPVLLVVSGYRQPIGIMLTTAGFMAFAKVAFELALSVRLP